MAKMWAGRFKKELDSEVNAFNSSISFDYRMYNEDIKGSVAHATMLEAVNVISKDDCDSIINGLNKISCDIKSGELQFDMTAEDIHMFIESELTSRIGDAGKRLHTARSRNDQVALDMRMYLMSLMKNVKVALCDLMSVIAELSSSHTSTIMAGYTHLQRAQPVTFAHHLMAYAEMFLRDYERAEDSINRANSLPLGACALATTTYPIDRFVVAKLLDFDKVCANSLDAVSDRDFCMEMSSVLSIIMVHLSRFSEEIILWCTSEFKYIDLDDAFATGSSIMPQKKNPDIAELVRGKSGRVIGDNMTLLTMMKGLPLAYNKDMQEDKEAIFDAFDTTILCLKTFAPMLASVKVNVKNMRDKASLGFINATDCADYLVSKGIAFRDAYKITGELVALCIDKDCDLETLTIDDYKNISTVFDDGIYNAISLETCLNNRNVYGGPSEEQVSRQVAMLKYKLKGFN